MSKPILAVMALAIALAPLQAGAQAAPPPAAVPLSLDGAIAIALERNLTYRAAHLAVEQARAGLMQAGAPRLPGVQVRDTYTYVNPVATLSTPFGSLPFSATKATNVPLVALQYSLFDGGLTAARVAQAAAELSAAQDAQRQARGAAIVTTTKAYYDLVSAMQMAQVAQRALQVATAHVLQAQRLLGAGQVARADVLRAQTEQANDRVNALAADDTVALAQTNLDAVLDVPQDRRYTPTDSLGGAVPKVELNSLIAWAFAHRGDLAAAGAAVEAAQAAVSQARAGTAPSVNLQVADGNTQPAVTAGFHNQFTVGVSAVWTLFDHGFTAGRIAAAKAAVAQAQNGLEQLRAGVELQVRQAYLQMTQAQARAQAAQQFVRLADENLRLAQVRYRGGVGTALELADAEQRDRLAHQALVQAEVGVREGVAQLRFAAGLL